MDENIIDLRNRKGKNNGFSVSKIDDGNSINIKEIESKLAEIDPEIVESAYRKIEENTNNTNKENTIDMEPKELIKVKFAKFVQLVGAKDVSGVIENNPNEDIIVSANLLSELAAPIEAEEPPKRPVQLIFVIGLVLGIILTILFIQK